MYFMFDFQTRTNRFLFDVFGEAVCWDKISRNNNRFPGYTYTGLAFLQFHRVTNMRHHEFEEGRRSGADEEEMLVRRITAIEG
jgi:hypothetical protein